MASSRDIDSNYEALKSKGKAYARAGRLEDALEVLTKAYALQPSEKLKSHLKNIKTLIEENELSSVELVPIADGFRMSSDMYNNLYPYQRQAIVWMWGLFCKKKGGVLGDDMGLGKTIQIIAFISAMLEEGHIKTALLIMPVSLIQNWCKEFEKWAPEVVVEEYHSNSKKEREKTLAKIQRSGGVLLTTYGIVTKNFEYLRTHSGRHFIWDYVVLDEGHKIRNPTKTTKAVHDIHSHHRLVLTGTPIQNNLKELWALYNFVHQGTLLGSLQTFKIHYETPIIKSREKDATAAEKLLGSRIAESLRQIIAPYFLRRTKQEVLQCEDDDKENADHGAFSKLKRDMMIRKNEFIVWVFMSPAQMRIYQEFLQSDRVKSILMSQTLKRSPLVELTVLKKICDHPRLLSHRACLQLGLEEKLTEQEIEDALEKEENLYFDISGTPKETLIEESGKMGVVFDLLENLHSEGHRTLLFSLSCRILDIIQKVLGIRGWKILRLDGKIRKTVDREKIVTAFQTDSSYPILLLTTQVGGVGLNLTAADRVIIYDPSWNPATDAQAVDRAFRIGQTKSVVVYRLITCGTVEEKIYRRQIFKDSIMQQTTGASKDPHRYFTKGELWDLFKLDNPRFSTTQRQLEEMHSKQRKSDTQLDSHIAFLHSLNIFGISDHDLMFKGIAEEQLDEEGNKSFIDKEVERAQLLITLESNLPKSDVVPKEKIESASSNPVLDRYPPNYDIPDVSVDELAQKFHHIGVNDTKVQKFPESTEYDNEWRGTSRSSLTTISSDDDDGKPVSQKMTKSVLQDPKNMDSKNTKSLIHNHEQSRFENSSHFLNNSTAKQIDLVVLSDDEEFANVDMPANVQAQHHGNNQEATGSSNANVHQNPKENNTLAKCLQYDSDGSSTEPCGSDDEIIFETSDCKVSGDFSKDRGLFSSQQDGSHIFNSSGIAKISGKSGFQLNSSCQQKLDVNKQSGMFDISFHSGGFNRSVGECKFNSSLQQGTQSSSKDGDTTEKAESVCNSSGKLVHPERSSSEIFDSNSTAQLHKLDSEPKRKNSQEQMSVGFMDNNAGGIVSDTDSQSSTEPCVDTDDDDLPNVFANKTAVGNKRKVSMKIRHRKPEVSETSCDSDSESEHSRYQDRHHLSRQNALDNQEMVQDSCQNSRDSLKRSSPSDSDDGFGAKRQYYGKSATKVQNNLRSSLSSIDSFQIDRLKNSRLTSSPKRKSIRRSQVFTIETSDESQQSDGFHTANTRGADGLNESLLSSMQETPSKLCDSSDSPQEKEELTKPSVSYRSSGSANSSQSHSRSNKGLQSSPDPEEESLTGRSFPSRFYLSRKKKTNIISSDSESD